MTRALLIAALALAFAGCGDNIHPGAPDAGPPPDGPPQPDAPMASDFTQFVHQQILCTTCDTAEPAPYAFFASLPDNDLENEAAYADLFQ